ncbi:hypothetical protein [Nonomuraea sp. NPDC048916]|uniref:hypothetical protein n=1 Tax=Nonomuraea sp. NPDC048916 TaxID=3154232 RepID=UPI0033E0FEF3
MFTAWGDESGSSHRLDPGTYMMAAAMGEPDKIEGIRDAMGGLLLRGQRKVHWRDEAPNRRVMLIDAIADLPVEGFVVVRSAGVQDRAERLRRKCLELLLLELSALGCGHLVLESRGPADDKRDRMMLENMRRIKQIDSTLRLAHEPGPSDPMLWIPDVICGAVGQARVGEAKYLDKIESRLTVKVLDETQVAEKAASPGLCRPAGSPEAHFQTSPQWV